MQHFTPKQELLKYAKDQGNQKKITRLLDKLQEESAECIQAVSKIRRFGPNNTHPERTTTNLQELVGELEDVLAIVNALESLGYINLTLSSGTITAKVDELLS